MTDVTLYGPLCRCGARTTKRVEGEYLCRYCSTCHSTYYYRLHDGHLLPYTKPVADIIDEERRNPKPRPRRGERPGRLELVRGPHGS